jgi:ankyrin repeat protein
MPILRAASHGGTSAAKYLLRWEADPLVKAKDGQTALKLAARHGPRDMLGMLLETGIDVNTYDQKSNTALLDACLRHVDRATPLRLLLNAGAGPKISAEKYNLQHGADVNAKCTDERMRSERDVTPIGLTASHVPYKFKSDVLKVLLDPSADLAGLNDRGLPALLACCADICGESQDFEIEGPVEFLLANGVPCLCYAVKYDKIRATLACLSRFNGDERDHAVDADNLGIIPLYIVCANTS